MLHACFLLLALISAANIPVVPMPASVAPLSGTYAVPKSVTISATTPDARNVADFAIEFLRSRGIEASVVPSPAGANLRLVQSAHDGDLGNEGYGLRIDASGISISSSGGAGLFYGLQTLEQLFPQSATDNTLGAVNIADKPAYAWRGMHLDSSRHFWDVATVERYIDLAAHYKINTFHWHLSDDQGWRVEIKRYPRLTSFGSCREGSEVGHNPLDVKGPRYCGYYTQAQIRDVVAYAAKRYINIVPEIDMPGHSTAAIASYPWLGCSGQQLPVSTRWGNSYPVCPTERAITFEENVLSELMDLFPSKYIHAGGDEVPFSAWKASPFVHKLMQQQHLTTYPQVQAYFERHIEQFIESKGRRMVGWNEILAGGISPNAVIMCWTGTGCGTRAVQHGNDAVMTPDGPLYLDAYQGDPNDEPEAIGSLSTLRMVYDYDPAAGVKASEQSHILGVQGNIWTEWIGSVPYLFYMALPRELAVSEIAWVPAANKDWDSFVERTGPQYAWLESHGYNFRIPNPTIGVDGGRLQFAPVSGSIRTVTAQTGGSSVTVTLKDSVPSATIYYTTDGTLPNAHARRYDGPMHFDLAPNQTLNITAAAILPDGRTSTPSQLVLRRATQ